MSRAGATIEPSVVVEMIRFGGIGFSVWWKRRVFSFVIGDSIFAVVKTNGVSTVDAGALEGISPSRAWTTRRMRPASRPVKWCNTTICFMRVRVAEGGGLWQGASWQSGGGGWGQREEEWAPASAGTSLRSQEQERGMLRRSGEGRGGLRGLCPARRWPSACRTDACPCQGQAGFWPSGSLHKVSVESA